MSKFVPGGQLDDGVDRDTIGRLITFVYDELRLERDAPKTRKQRWFVQSSDREKQLGATFDTLIQISKELSARGSLRSPTMFSATDDATVSTVQVST